MKKLNLNLSKDFQVNFAYNTNAIEGNPLQKAQVERLWKKKRLQVKSTGHEGLDMLRQLELDNASTEITNHFKCVNYIVSTLSEPLTEKWLFKLHGILLRDTKNSGKDWYTVGGYKTVPNMVGGRITALPKEVKGLMDGLLNECDENRMTLHDIAVFHCRYERIHPFIDGNGRTGRLVMFRQCIKNNISPFIVEYATRARYYKSLANFPGEEAVHQMISYFNELQEKFKQIVQKGS